MAFQSILKLLVGDKHKRERKRLWPMVEHINEIAHEFTELSDDELRAKTGELRQRLTEGETVEDVLAEAYAVVKEACRRNVGRSWTVTGQEWAWDMVPFDVQLFGAIVLHEGKIAEMATGEGKTLVATHAALPQCPRGQGRPPRHRQRLPRPARLRSGWGEILRWLGLTVGVIQHDMTPEQRRAAYACDITYGTNNEFGFDYLRDNMVAAARSPGAARPQLRHRRRGRFRAHRRSAHPAHHLRPHDPGFHPSSMSSSRWWIGSFGSRRGS